MVFVVRNDLKMGKGKVAAQVSSCKFKRQNPSSNELYSKSSRDIIPLFISLYCNATQCLLPPDYPLCSVDMQQLEHTSSLRKITQK